jgi:predicted signal transduction protein with EAL and GGDEF domain
VLPVLRSGRDLTRLVDAWIADFQKHPFHLNDTVFHISAKGGVALFPNDGTDAATLFKHAEAALKKAKANGERYLFYTQTMTAAGAANLTLENQLRQALDNEEYERGGLDSLERSAHRPGAAGPVHPDPGRNRLDP